MVDRVLCHSSAKGSAKLVLLGIARHHGRRGSWPALATLAGYANVDERRVRRVIRDLEELGELVVEQRPGTSNRYVLSIQCPADCSFHSPGVSTRPTPGVSTPPPRASRPGEHTNEPNNKNSENVTYLNAGARDEIDEQWEALMAEGVR